MQVGIVPCSDPQLVVVRGLLLDRQQRMEGRGRVLVHTKARSSYGVVVRQLYDPSRHFGEEVQQDRFQPDQMYAINQIEWIIKKVRAQEPSSPKAPNAMQP